MIEGLQTNGPSSVRFRYTANSFGIIFADVEPPRLGRPASEIQVPLAKRQHQPAAFVTYALHCCPRGCGAAAQEIESRLVCFPDGQSGS